MLQRHEILPSGLKVDRDWWFATKVATIVGGAVAISATLALLI